MKSPHGHAVGRVIREGRLRNTPTGRPFIESTIEMDEPHQYERGDYCQRVDICSMRDDQLALVSLLKIGARVRVEGDIDWTSHKDGFREITFGRVRITGSIEIMREVGH